MDVRRRCLDISLVIILLVGPLAIDAQPTEKIWRIGILSPRTSLDADPLTGFLQGMRELGYVDGRNVRYEWRFADGTYERLPVLAAELIQLRVDVIVVGGTPATRAAQR